MNREPLHDKCGAHSLTRRAKCARRLGAILEAEPRPALVARPAWQPRRARGIGLEAQGYVREVRVGVTERSAAEFDRADKSHGADVARIDSRLMHVDRLDDELTHPRSWLQ